MKCWTTRLIGCLLILASYCNADTLNGKVVKVADGDTVTVLDSTNTQHRIRLTGIDTPEMGQPFGNAAKKHMTTLVAGKMVMVEYEKSDRFGRILGKAETLAPQSGQGSSLKTAFNDAADKVRLMLLLSPT